MDEAISFEEVATIRPDGAHNIFHASVVSENMILPDDYVCMKGMCGPYRYVNKKYLLGQNCLWRLDTEWSERRLNVNAIDNEIAERILSLERKEAEEGLLSKDDYAWLAEQGCIKTNGDYEGCFKSAWQLVVLANKEIRDKLLATGEKIKTKYKEEFAAIKAPYVKAVLNSVPAHLKKIKEYELQFVFHSDGWFLLHCIVVLLNNGKLKPPTEEQRKALTTLIVPN